MCRWPALLASIAVCSIAADSRVETLRQMLPALRAEPRQSKIRGASPKLTVIKHLLRDWVDSRIATLASSANMDTLQRDLNAELRSAGLLCSWYNGKETPCPEELQLGYLSTIELRRERGFVVLITRVGIECGFDESAYLYGRSTKGWRRLWQTEQNIYQPGKYKPQTIVSVQVSADAPSNNYLVLTLGREPWCQSNWHDVYYRVFRPGSNPEVRPLIDKQEWAFISEIPISGSISPKHALVEMIGSGFPGEFLRVVRSFQIDRNQVTRVDPIALRPRDFVQEWLTNDWNKEAWRWTEPAQRTASMAWHQRLRTKDQSDRYFAQTLNCPAHPGLSQVALDLNDPKAPFDRAAVKVYFVVRSTPPYIFRMVQVSNHPDPKCTEPADEQERTLFPTRQ